jgi:uncharacterized protein (TIGR02217 family)
MDDFIETPRFPTRISYGSTGGPKFTTFLFESPGGVEGREIAWDQARAEYRIDLQDHDKSDMDTVRAFFLNARGRARGFRFKDWHDYSMTDELIGTGDGVTRVFNIIKNYGSGDLAYQRRIYKPIDGTLTVKVNGTPVSATISYTAGTVTFSVPNTPAVADLITVTCEFDVPVRFDTDELSASSHDFEQQSWGGIPLVELKLD